MISLLRRIMHENVCNRKLFVRMRWQKVKFGGRIGITYSSIHRVATDVVRCPRTTGTFL